LIAGATGTGKTVTLQRLAEGFSQIGVPVFMADVKGDLAGLSQPGRNEGKIKARLAELKLEEDFTFEAVPVVFWDAFGAQGHPVRTTVSELGPLLLSRMLSLNETQAGVLTATFKIADDAGLPLVDLKDLRAMLKHVADNSKEYTTRYGNISSASVGAIQRGLLTLEQQGGEQFFGEPALDIDDLLQTDGGRGVINILTADKLMSAPKLYAVLLLWLLAELFEQLPEVGDPEKPKLVFFFDEAHLLFDDAPGALVEKIEQVVRLIRSKGVGVYFVTQNPLDIPDAVLGQLGNRVQHALRAFTPRDQKAVATAASTLRANPKLDVERAITELAVGEALVSFLDDSGKPSVVERALVLPPGSRLGPVTEEERKRTIQQSVVGTTYDQAIDKESAYEMLLAKHPDMAGGAAQPQQQGYADTIKDMIFGSTGPRGGRREGLLESMAKSAMRAAASRTGREIADRVLRGVLGSLSGTPMKSSTRSRRR
jgi:DNA helicase HerA-like ATPase